MVLPAVGQQAARIKDIEITGFLAMAGEAYDRELMVIGRAVNGWTNEIFPSQLVARVEAEKYARDVQEGVNGNGECPMLWVTTGWGAGEGYNTKRSPFWRGIRSVAQDLGIVRTDLDWASHLVWSNLYKVSPASGGNPSPVLREIQLAGCIDLLRLELNTYRPSRVLLLTGADWAAPFLEDAEFQDDTAEFQYVERVGTMRGARCVIAAHPQGKPESTWVREVIAAFDG